MVLPDADWARAQISRRQKIELAPRCQGYVASPEDLIIGKLIYHLEGGSGKHLRDIRGMLLVSGEKVDRTSISAHSKQLSVSDTWESILNRLAS